MMNHWNHWSVGLAIAFLAFCLGVSCAEVAAHSIPRGPGTALSALFGSALCFLLAYAGEEARRRKSDAAVALVLPMLCAGFALLVAGAWLLVESFFAV